MTEPRVQEIDSEPEPESEPSPRTPRSDDEGFVDILGSGDILKKVTVDGQGRETRPQEGQAAEIELSVAVDDVEIDPSTDAMLGNLEMTVGDNDISYALDLAVRLMEVGETSLLRTSTRYDTRCLDNPQAKVEYTVKLVSVKDAKLIQDMTEDERLEYGSKKKSRGNELYSLAQYDLASMCFSKALKYLTEGMTEKEASSQIKQMKVQCLGNIAAVQLKSEAYKDVIKTCDDALHLQPNASKPLYRKAKALNELHEYKDASAILKTLIKKEPSNSSARTLLAAVVEGQQKEKEAQKSLYTKMVSALDGTSPDVVARQKELDIQKRKESEARRGAINRVVAIWIVLGVVIITTALYSLWPLLFPPMTTVTAARPIIRE